jgi:hypothetical protein
VTGRCRLFPSATVSIETAEAGDLQTTKGLVVVPSSDRSGGNGIASVIIIRTKNGTEIRVPLEEFDTITEVEPTSGNERPVPAHPYLHREGVNRCAACWRPRAHPAHSETAVRER